MLRLQYLVDEGVVVEPALEKDNGARYSGIRSASIFKVTTIVNGVPTCVPFSLDYCSSTCPVSLASLAGIDTFSWASSRSRSLQRC
jgi:hypothetical protein